MMLPLQYSRKRPFCWIEQPLYYPSSPMSWLSTAWSSLLGPGKRRYSWTFMGHMLVHNDNAVTSWRMANCHWWLNILVVLRFHWPITTSTLVGFWPEVVELFKRFECGQHVPPKTSSHWKDWQLVLIWISSTAVLCYEALAYQDWRYTLVHGAICLRASSNVGMQRSTNYTRQCRDVCQMALGLMHPCIGWQTWCNRQCRWNWCTFVDCACSFIPSKSQIRFWLQPFCTIISWLRTPRGFMEPLGASNGCRINLGLKMFLKSLPLAETFAHGKTFNQRIVSFIDSWRGLSEHTCCG